MNALLSILFYIYFFVGSAVWSAVLAVIVFVHAKKDSLRKLAHHLTSDFAYNCIKLNRSWKCNFQGLEHIDDSKTYVFVANHQSMADVLVLCGIKKLYKWVAKVQVMSLFGVGHLMRVNQYISIEHKSISSVRRMLKQGRHWLKQGVSIFIFPEGERSHDGNLLHFKEGPFRMAADCDVPVVPIVIEGTRKILPRSRMILNFRADVQVKVLPPVYPSQFNYDVLALRDHVRELIAAELDAMRGVHIVHGAEFGVTRISERCDSARAHQAS